MFKLTKPEYFWPALWTGVALAGAAVIALEHQFGRVEIGGGPHSPARLVEAKLLPPFNLPPEAQAAPETAARPLFAPGRRPAPPAASTMAPTMRKGQFVLTGVTVAPGAAFAFLKEIATGKTQSAKLGSVVNGMTVEAVDPRRVVLRQGEESEELPLNIQVPTRVATVAAPTGAVPAAPGATPVAPRPPGTVPPGPAPPSTVPTGIISPGTVPPAAPAAPASPAVQSEMPVVPAPAPGRRRPWLTAK